MRYSKKTHLVFIGTLLNVFFILTVFAGEDCIRCGDKDIVGSPDQKNEVTKLAFAVMADPKKIIYPFSDYIATYCMKYEQIEKNALNTMIREMVKSPYPVDDYFQEKACKPQRSGDRKSPIIHLTAEAPCSRVEYPEIIHKYYTVKRNSSDIWLKIVNSKNSKEETFLDYIEYLDNKNMYNTVETKKCMNQLIAFACKNGAIYSTSNKTCPTGI